MDNLNSAVQVLIHGSNTLFILLGAVMVLAMHAGFAFLEVGTVRLKNQVNALSKILSDFAISALAYFFVGYWIAYGVTFFHPGGGADRGQWLCAGEVLLPADLRRGDPGDHFRWHRRACPVRSAVVRHGADRGLRVPFFEAWCGTAISVCRNG